MQQSEKSWCWRPDTAIRHGSAVRIIGGKAAGLHKQAQAGKERAGEEGERVPSPHFLLESNSRTLHGNTTTYAVD